MKPEKNIPDDLLSKHLEQNLNAQEQEQLEAWLGDADENQAELNDLETIWNAAEGAAELDGLDVDADWNAVSGQLKDAAPEAKVRKLSWVTIAAAAAAIFLFSTSILQMFNTTSPSVQQYALADGTKVWVKEGTNFTAPESFDGNQRVVQLKGKAYFDVAENPNKPFIIKTENGGEITVLGTSFNVQTSPKTTEVIVKTGKVQLADKAGKNAIQMEANERGIYREGDLEKDYNENPNFQSWRTGNFVFDNTPLNEVVWNLSTFYKKPIVLADSNIDCNLTAFFQRENISTILETLEKSCALKSKEQDGEYVLYR